MDSRSLIDDILEVSIVGSFSRVGFQVRLRVFEWDSPADGALTGRTALVTGPTSGLGREVAGELASLLAKLLRHQQDRWRAANRVYKIVKHFKS